MKWRVGILLLVGLQLAAIDTALACRGGQFHLSIFFDDIPQNIDVDVIARVTILDNAVLVEDSGTSPRKISLSRARVDEVIKGTLTAKTILIQNSESSCGGVPGNGQRGMILGKIIHETAGESRLWPVLESPYGREKRIQQQQKPQ